MDASNHDALINTVDHYLARKWRMKFAEYMTVKIEDGLCELNAEGIKRPLSVY